MASSRLWIPKALYSGTLLAIAFSSIVVGLKSVQAVEVNPQDSAPAEAPPTETIPQTSAPAELHSMVEGMDQAANDQRLKPFLAYFDKSFAHADGLGYQQLKQSVRFFWEQFDQLAYSTTLTSWEELSPGLYETVTTTSITGRQGTEAPRARKLMATITSKQKVQDGKILSQSVMEEQSQIVSGDKPPTVQVNLPKTVTAGQDYFFDLILEEPLGDRILLGAAIDEAVEPKAYLNPSEFEIQTLATGGLFKVGQAPADPRDQWISALLIQDGGMYMMSQRVSVVPSSGGKAQEKIVPSGEGETQNNSPDIEPGIEEQPLDTTP